MPDDDSSSDDEKEDAQHTQHLSAYERKRQGNISRNQAVLLQLGLAGGPSLLGTKRAAAGGGGGKARQPKSKQPKSKALSSQQAVGR